MQATETLCVKQHINEKNTRVYGITQYFHFHRCIRIMILQSVSKSHMVLLHTSFMDPKVEGNLLKLSGRLKTFRIKIQVHV